MTVESAATFLVCVILLSCGIIVLVGVILLVNNMLHRYWKDLHWNLPENLRAMRDPVPYQNLDHSQEPPLDRK
jgi:CBS-domain-containing membrane protein